MQILDLGIFSLKMCLHIYIKLWLIPNWLMNFLYFISVFILHINTSIFNNQIEWELISNFLWFLTCGWYQISANIIIKLIFYKFLYLEPYSPLRKGNLSFMIHCITFVNKILCIIKIKTGVHTVMYIKRNTFPRILTGFFKTYSVNCNLI